MTSFTTKDSDPDNTLQPTTPASDRSRRRRLGWLLLAAVLAVAVALRHMVAAGTDVSWLLTVGEWVLDGRRLYADIVETNPPIAVWAYLPGLLLARAAHLRAETVTDALVFAGIAAAMWTAVRILRRAPQPAHGWPLALVCAAVLTLLPMQAFGQREHLALIAWLPALAAHVVRAKGGALPLWAMIAAGLGAGITLAFKPYFVLPVGACVVTAAIAARSWRILFAPEHFIAAATVALYSLMVWTLYPDYFTLIYPLVRDVYLPVQQPLAALLGSPATSIWIAAVILALLLARRGRADAGMIVLMVASLGFAVAFLLQRKGWPYQSYPMITLALIALGDAIVNLRITTAADKAWRLGALAGLTALCLGAAAWMNQGSDARALQGPVARLGPHPKILVLSAEASIGFPLTRAVNGTWVSRQWGQWIQEFVARRRRDHPLDAQTDARLDGYVARERAQLIADIKRDPPSVVLVDNLLGDWGAKLRADAELSALLKDYRRVETVEKIDILTRAE
jgi:hypothetical protein